jgi:hypothetical protein
MANFDAIVLSKIAKVALTMGYGVVSDGINIVDLPDADNEVCMGLVEHSQPTAGGHVGVATEGTSNFAVAGAALAIDVDVILDSTGRFITIPAVTGTYNVFGRSLKKADAAGDYFEILINPRSVEVVAG